MLEEHRVYLSDRARLRAFRRAIALKVRRGDVVLDLGAGTGILGILALRAGASRVYAVDRGPILESARAAAREAGFADRWTGIRGHSTEVDLPGRVDLVVADQVGCFGLDYGILGDFADARARHLRPGGRLLPEAVEVDVALVSSTRLYERVAFWGSRPAGLRLPGLRRLAAHTVTHGLPTRREVVSAPAAVVAVDLGAAADGPLEGEATLRAARAAVVHGLVGSFRCRLAPGVRITNAPLARGRLSRSPVFLPLERPLRVRRGERLAVSLRLHPDRDLVAWSVGREGGPPAVHSSFLGLLLDPGDLRRLRPDRRARLSPRGRAMARVLDLCRRGATVAGIREDLLRRFPRIVPGEREAAAFVAEVLDQAARQDR